ncbi:MAG: hypothetical protein JNK25_05070 [Phycisphaerae bacterium]|nr:hypothetical protein [Phycisphaerae bacterium]
MTCKTGSRLITSASLLAMLAGLNPALAVPPAALDRVPDNAPVVVALRSMQAATEKVNKFSESMGIPRPEGDNPIAMAQKMLGTPGLNAGGSMAVAIVPGPDGKVIMGEDAGDKTTGVVIVPVSDYAAFVKAMGAEKSDGVTSVNIDGKPGFIKDLQGGFAAITVVPGLLDKFDGAAGKGPRHAAMLGKNGGGIADTADVLIIANVAHLQDQLKDGRTRMKDQMEQATMMLGDQAAGIGGSLALLDTVMGTFAKDATCGVLGLTLNESGITADLGTQFKEGTEPAGFFSSPGSAGVLLGRIPNLPFYFAGAIDTSSPGLRQIFKNIAKAQSPQAGDGASPMSFLANIDKLGGFSGILGASPNALSGGGLFVNTSTFVATTDPAGYTALLAEQIKAANGRKEGPVTTKSTYKAGTAEVSGIKVDSWSMTMDIDQNDPTAMQAQMMSSMLFGMGEFGGMNAPVDGGVVSTYSMNTPLLTSAIEAAKTGNGLASASDIKEAASRLPADRSLELHIGVKPLLDAALGLAAMFGGGPDVTLPEKISPISIGASTTNGGMVLRVVLPMDTMKAFGDIAKQMNEGGDDDMDDPAPAQDGGKPPRF